MNAADFPRVGLTEAIERLGAMPRFLDAALKAAKGDELRFRPGEGAFSLTGQACHLRDLEREGYLVRVRRLLAEEAPVLEPFDGDKVAAERDYQRQDARAAARDFAAARHELLAQLARLDDAQLKRTGRFEGKALCVADLIAMILEHDAGHREEIEEIVDALSAD